MSICDRCIHDEVCGLEDNHEEAMTYCGNMIPIDVFEKIRAEVESINPWALEYAPTEDKDIRPQTVSNVKEHVLQIIDKYRAESEE